MATGKEPWHLDRKVPIALIVTILIQSAAAVWFAAVLYSRVNVLERDVERQRVVDQTQNTNINRLVSDAAAQDQKLESILDIVERMDRRLERVIDGN